MTSRFSATLMLAALVAGNAACVGEGGIGGGGAPSKGSAAGGDAAADRGPAVPAIDAPDGNGGTGGNQGTDAPAAATDVPQNDEVGALLDAPAVADLRAEGPISNPMAGPAGPWARGVSVGLVEATQGVFVKVGEGATVVTPDMRNAPLIEGRPIYARVHITTQAGFMARRLRAVMSLEYADKTRFEVEDAKMISGPSNVERLETTFNFLVPAGSVKPNTTLVASVYEAAAAVGAEPTAPPRFPATGAADLAIKAGRMELWVVAVPTPGLMDTPERRKKLENDLYDLYPVQKVNLRIHEPVTIDGAFSSTKGFAALRTTREQDNGKPWEHYHLVTNATGVSYAGVAQVAGATANDGARRIGITITRTAAIDGNTNTTAHEIGHNHGRPHAPGCGAAGADAMYPYRMPAGDMGVNGYSLTTSAFKSRTMFRELMSYCRPRWISDYMWRQFEARVRAVSALAGAAMPMTQMLATRSLQGFAGPGETPDWGVVAGELVDASASVSAARYALLRLGDGRQVKVPVGVNEMTDHQTLEFSVNLNGPDYTDGDVIEAEVFVDGVRRVVPVAGLYRR